MFPLFIAIAAAHLIGLLIVSVATFWSPLGYEDQNGFHPQLEPEPEQGSE